jgi:hypothetical protein
MAQALAPSFLMKARLWVAPPLSARSADYRVELFCFFERLPSAATGVVSQAHSMLLVFPCHTIPRAVSMASAARRAVGTSSTNCSLDRRRIAVMIVWSSS